MAQRAGRHTGLDPAMLSEDKKTAGVIRQISELAQALATTQQLGCNEEKSHPVRIDSGHVHIVNETFTLRDHNAIMLKTQ